MNGSDGSFRSGLLTIDRLALIQMHTSFTQAVPTAKHASLRAVVQQ
jgi:hypothetical protein